MNESMMTALDLYATPEFDGLWPLNEDREISPEPWTYARDKHESRLRNEGGPWELGGCVEGADTVRELMIDLHQTRQKLYGMLDTVRAAGGDVDLVAGAIAAILRAQADLVANWPMPVGAEPAAHRSAGNGEIVLEWVGLTERHTLCNRTKLFFRDIVRLFDRPAAELEEEILNGTLKLFPTRIGLDVRFASDMVARALGITESELDARLAKQRASLK